MVDSVQRLMSMYHLVRRGSEAMSIRFRLGFTQSISLWSAVCRYVYLSWVGWYRLEVGLLKEFMVKI